MTPDENDIRIFPELLKEGRTISIVPHGLSMVPLLDGKQDSVTIKPKEIPLRVNDLVFYKDREDRLVVHRVWEVRQSGYVLLGDGNVEKEFPIPEENVYGICTSITRKGKSFSAESKGYRAYAKLWRWLYPIRYYILKIIKKTYTEETTNERIQKT